MKTVELCSKSIVFVLLFQLSTHWFSAHNLWRLISSGESSATEAFNVQCLASPVPATGSLSVFHLSDLHLPPCTQWLSSNQHVYTCSQSLRTHLQCPLPLFLCPCTTENLSLFQNRSKQCRLLEKCLPQEDQVSVSLCDLKQFAKNPSSRYQWSSSQNFSMVHLLATVACVILVTSHQSFK